MEIGIRELRSNLSAILDQVDKGATVTITDRGKRRAYLVPAPVETPLERGMREGWVSVGPEFGHRTGPRPPIATFQSRPGVSPLQALLDDRAADR